MEQNIQIVKSSMNYLEDCVEAIRNSTLGDKYFSGDGSARKAVLEGINQESQSI